MDFLAYFAAPPKPISAVKRHGFLALGLSLLACHVAWIAFRYHGVYAPRHRVQLLIIVALIVNHLAFRFPWSQRVTVALRVGAALLIAVTVWQWLGVVRG